MEIIDICGRDIVRIGDGEIWAWFRVDLALPQRLELARICHAPLAGREISILEELD